MIRSAALFSMITFVLAGCTLITEIDYRRIEGQNASSNSAGAGVPTDGGAMGNGGFGGAGISNTTTTGGQGAGPTNDADTTPRPLSCVADRAGADWKCGWQGNADCCASKFVEGGTFNRGNDPAYPATVSPFLMDVYEITVGRFRAFIDAGMGTGATAPAEGAGAPKGVSDGGWRNEWNQYLAASSEELRFSLQCDSVFGTYTEQPIDRERHPINCLTWYEASAFCIWDGGRLPTEAEWNFVAAHGAAQAMYPWGGAAITDERAVYQCSGDGSEPYDCSERDIGAVGSRPAGASWWGHQDVVGNVWEWTLDLSAKYKNPCVDCVNLHLGADHIARGGGFSDPESLMRSYIRYAEISETRQFAIGARCVKEL
jgi:formylglycine-generating enzyme required for sulfatase activity